MRMIFPGVRERRSIDRSLSTFFHTYAASRFHRAVAALSRFYHLRTPRVEWFEYLDWGKSGGRTFENGKIHLVHPENWKRGRKYNTERRWMQTVYHEMGHYVLWADAERKADLFAHGFVRGVSPGPTPSYRAARSSPEISRSRPRRRRPRSRSR
jgi:hypothetical protein